MGLESFTLTHLVVAMLIGQVAAVCRNKPDNHFVADPTDPRRFFWCKEGEAYPSKCPAGTIFFEAGQYCDTDPCTNKPDNHFVADPYDRHRFFWCFEGESHPSICPDGLIFFEEGQYCNTDSTTARPGPPTRPPVTTKRPNAGPCKNMADGTFVADPSDRRWFFWCSGGDAHPSKCPEGMFFFEDGQFCDEDVVTTARPLPPTRPPPGTTARPPPPTRPPLGTTARPPPPTRPPLGTTARPLPPTRQPTATTTRSGLPPIPSRQPTAGTTRSGLPPIPSRQPPAGK